MRRGSALLFVQGAIVAALLGAISGAVLRPAVGSIRLPDPNTSEFKRISRAFARAQAMAIP